MLAAGESVTTGVRPEFIPPWEQEVVHDKSRQAE